MTSLVVAEHVAGELQDTTLELITAARQFGPVTVAVIGPPSSAVVDAADVEGVAEILIVDADTNGLDSDGYRTVLAEIIETRQPALTLLASTAHSIAYGAAVAAEKRLGFASDVHGLRLEDGQIIAVRSFYNGKVHAELEFPDDTGVLLLLRQRAWKAASGDGNAVRTTISSANEPSRTHHIELIGPAGGDDVDLTQADLIVAVGRGIGEQEHFALFESLAEKMGATLAVSRPLVDAGWAPASRQVGQSGKTVKPKMYVAFGISGASQHLAGMQSSETIVAINNDANAAIFTVADYGAVFDAVALAQELEKLY